MFPRKLPSHRIAYRGTPTEAHRANKPPSGGLCPGPIGGVGPKEYQRSVQLSRAATSQITTPKSSDHDREAIRSPASIDIPRGLILLTSG